MVDKYFKERRTIRKYSDKEIEESLIDEMLEAAMYAPNTGNMQLYSVIVTRSEEGKRQLASTHFNQPASTGCSVLLTFCADFNRFEHWCRVSDAIPGYNNFQAFSWALIDATIFAQQFCTIAEMSGLGCCYLGTTTYNAPQIAEILSLPERVVPVVTIAVGYPDDVAMRSDRLPLQAIKHSEKYHNYSDDSIHSVYSKKESLVENQGFVSENGKATLAQVFTDIRYTKEANEHFSKIFLDFIEKQGFTIR